MILKKIVLVCLILSPLLIRAQTPGQREGTVVKYEEIAGVPVIRVGIGSNIYNFLVDTGAGISCVSDKIVNDLGLDYSPSMFSMNDSDEKLFIASIPTLTIGDLTLGPVAAAVMSEENPILKTLSSHGVIGANILNQFIITFDARDMSIAFGLETDGQVDWEPLGFWNEVPLFNIKLRGGDKLYDVPALFDSGNGTAALGLPSVEGFEEWTGAGIIHNVEEGRGVVGTMVGGLVGKDVLYRGNIAELHLGGAEFGDIPVMTGGMGYLLLCYKITDLGTVTIDYPGKRYRFTPYSDTRVWEPDWRPVMTGPDGGELRIAAVWGDKTMKKIKPGNVVVAVNDMPVTVQDGISTDINAIILSINATEGTVTIKNDKGKLVRLPAKYFLPGR